MSDESEQEVHQLLDADRRRFIEKLLRSCRFVEWDRFTIFEHPDVDGEVGVTAYGWIDRDDEYKDFAVFTAWTAAKEVQSFTTSSAEYSEELYERLTGEEPEGTGHNECRRVEDTFNVENASTLEVR